MYIFLTSLRRSMELKKVKIEAVIMACVEGLLRRRDDAITCIYPSKAWLFASSLLRRKPYICKIKHYFFSWRSNVEKDEVSAVFYYHISSVKFTISSWYNPFKALIHFRISTFLFTWLCCLNIFKRYYTRWSLKFKSLGVF